MESEVYILSFFLFFLFFYFLLYSSSACFISALDSVGICLFFLVFFFFLICFASSCKQRDVSLALALFFIYATSSNTWTKELNILKRTRRDMLFLLAT